MYAAKIAPERCEFVGACRLVRGRWSEEERRRRRRVAEGKQRQLWRLLETARARQVETELTTTVLVNLPA